MTETLSDEPQARQTLIELAEDGEGVIRCTDPSGLVCDIVAVPLEVTEDHVWVWRWEYPDGEVTNGQIIPLHDAVYNRIHECTPDVTLIPESESLFGGGE